jgi:hypothetical protein
MPTSVLVNLKMDLKMIFLGTVHFANSWSEIANLPSSGRTEAVGFEMGGQGYVGTGKSSTGLLKDFWAYYPSSDSWEQKADLPGVARSGAVGCAVFPSAFIALGEDPSHQYKEDVWEYHYFGNIWTQRADYMGGPRTQASAFVVNNRIFFGLGYDGVYHDDFYEYTQILGLTNPIDKEYLNIYPNPASTEFFIEINQISPGTNPRIFSMSGKDVTDHFTINQSSPNVLQVLNDSNLKGIYFIKFSGNNGLRYISKIVLTQ